MNSKEDLFLSFLESFHKEDPALIEAAYNGYLSLNKPDAVNKAEKLKQQLTTDPAFKDLLITARRNAFDTGTTQIEKDSATTRRRESLFNMENYIKEVISKTLGYDDPDALRILWLWANGKIQGKISG